MDSTVYMPRGASTQAISIKKAAPMYGFGSATREQANKVFVSQEHTLIALGGSDSPGPAGYILPPSVGGKQPNGKMADPPVWAFGTANRFQIGKSEKKPGPDEYKMYPSIGGNQPDGARENAPEWGFGTATRDQINKLFISQEHTLTILAGTQSPGPACYTLPKSVSAKPQQPGTAQAHANAQNKTASHLLPSLPCSQIGGKQPDGRKEDAPSYGFSTAARTQVEPGQDGPGPVYKVRPSIGPCPDGKFANAPLYGFGASTREIRAKVFISQEHNLGVAPFVPTPGPAAPYALNPGIGNQVRSNKRTSPRVSFAKYSRWADHERS